MTNRFHIKISENLTGYIAKRDGYQQIQRELLAYNEEHTLATIDQTRKSDLPKEKLQFKYLDSGSFNVRNSELSNYTSPKLSGLIQRKPFDTIRDFSQWQPPISFSTLTKKNEDQFYSESSSDDSSQNNKSFDQNSLQSEVKQSIHKSIKEIMNQTRVDFNFQSKHNMRPQIVERVATLPNNLTKHFRRPTSALQSRFGTKFQHSHSIKVEAQNKVTKTPGRQQLAFDRLTLSKALQQIRFEKLRNEDTQSQLTKRTSTDFEFEMFRQRHLVKIQTNTNKLNHQAKLSCSTKTSPQHKVNSLLQTAQIIIVPSEVLTPVTLNPNINVACLDHQIKTPEVQQFNKSQEFLVENALKRVNVLDQSLLGVNNSYQTELDSPLEIEFKSKISIVTPKNQNATSSQQVTMVASDQIYRQQRPSKLSFVQKRPSLFKKTFQKQNLPLASLQITPALTAVNKKEINDQQESLKTPDWDTENKSKFKTNTTFFTTTTKMVAQTNTTQLNQSKVLQNTIFQKHETLQQKSGKNSPFVTLPVPMQMRTRESRNRTYTDQIIEPFDSQSKHQLQSNLPKLNEKTQQLQSVNTLSVQSSSQSYQNIDQSFKLLHKQQMQSNRTFHQVKTQLPIIPPTVSSRNQGRSLL